MSGSLDHRFEMELKLVSLVGLLVELSQKWGMK